MVQICEFNVLSLQALKSYFSTAIPKLTVSIVVTTKDMEPVKFIPLENGPIVLDAWKMTKLELRTLIENEYMAIKHLKEARLLLGVTDKSANFTVYKELALQ